MKKVFSLLIFLLFLQTSFAQTETTTQTQILDFSVIVSVIIVLAFIVLFVLIAIAIIGLVYYLGFKGSAHVQPKPVTRDSDYSMPRIVLTPKKEEEKEPEISKPLEKPVEKPLTTEEKETQENEAKSLAYKELELDDSSIKQPFEEKKVVEEIKEKQPKKLFSFGWKTKTETESKPVEEVKETEKTEEKVFEAKPIIETEEEKEKSKISKAFLDRFKIKK